MAAVDTIRVLIVDDHPIVRDGLRGQLATQPDLQVVAEAANAEEALTVLQHHAVDVLLTDLRMPGLGGHELIRTVRVEYPKIQVLVLTTYDGEDDVRPALDAGARGYLLKDARREALFAAVRAAAAGRSSFAPSVQRLQAQSPSRSLLSTREVEVLDLIAHGCTNRQIASALSIGEATVKTHVRHLCDKLEVADRAAAVAAGYQRGLL